MSPLTVDMLPDGSDALAGASLAQYYYDGMLSALYALASTGSFELYPGDGLDRLMCELRGAIRCAYEYAPEDVDDLTALLAWCDAWQSEHSADND